MSTETSFARDLPDGCTVSVRVHPGAKKDAVTGIHGNAVKIALSAPPVDGRANDTLIAFVAEQLRLPRSRVSLISGASNRSKVLRITGKSAAEVQAALSSSIDC
jgi:uncharacterized protein (TIGR00251 family)